jgi:hypothetical protein
MICTAHQIFLDDKIDTNEMGGACSTYGERRGIYRNLVRRPKGKRSLGRHRCSWDDNINNDHQNVGWGSIDLIDLAVGRGRWWALVNAVMNLGILYNKRNFLTG